MPQQLPDVTKKQLQKLNQMTNNLYWLYFYYHVNSTEILHDMAVECNLQGTVISE